MPSCAHQPTGVCKTDARQTHPMIRSIFLALWFVPLAVFAAGVRLTPGVPVLVPAGTPTPVRMAVEDLRRDLLKVFGAPSPIVTDAADLHGRAAIIILGPGG